MFNSIFCIIKYAISKIIICKKLVTLVINYSTLFVQNIIVIKKVLTDFKVPVLNFCLSLCNAFVKPRMVNRFSRLHADTAHHDFHTFAAEQTHKIVVH